MLKLMTKFPASLKSSLWVLLLSIFLFGCKPEIAITPTIPTETEMIPTSTSTLDPTNTVSITPTVRSFANLVFYGDSSLAIGEVGDGIEHVGYSFVPYLDDFIDTPHNYILANYGGRTAKWAYEHWDEKISSLKPDVLTIWFGLNDLGGCPGSFDRTTNQLLEYEVNNIVREHISSLSGLIDASLDEDTPVMILTTIPVLNGKLLWSHLDEEYNIVWEDGNWCDFILAEEILVQAQKDLVLEYSSTGRPVYLVDVWQIYKDNPRGEKMYMDGVHPGSTGAQLIAQEWARVFQELVK